MAAADERTWDRAAHGYGRQEHLERAAIARALDLAAPAREDVLLDVATGTGLVLRELARRPARPARAVGLEASAGMLARVGPLPAGWRAERGDATAMACADASVDVAVAAYLLHVLSPTDRAAALAELRRVVRPGGRLVVVTVWSARPASRAVLRALAAAAPEQLGGLRPLDPRAELVRAGWLPQHAATVLGGYPSMVVLARRPADQPGMRSSKRGSPSSGTGSQGAA